MKKILITGINSYIGTSFEKWVNKWPDKYKVESIDVRTDSWRELSFKGYDVILHVAAIVHVKEKNTNEYYKVNRDLALDIAKKAKCEGVKQFIFLSTMGVYGIETGYITKDTEPKPITPYAKSKYEAEKLLNELDNECFKVAILRPPIVYGENCKGNYPKLASLAKKLPVFPDLKNQRSMIYIDNLSEFIRLLIDYEIKGLFFPQNKDYVSVTELVTYIAKIHGKEIKTTKLFNLAINLGFYFSKTLKKIFGSFVYDKELPGGPGTNINGIEFIYETCSFEESVYRTEYIME